MRPLVVFRKTPKIDFMRYHIAGFAFSALLTVVSIVAFLTMGLNYGIDFKGGVLIEARSTAGTPPDLGQLRAKIDSLHLGENSLQGFGSPNDVLIRLARQSGGDAGQEVAVKTLRDALGSTIEFRRVEVVGPKVGEELVQAGALATVLALLAIAGYVWFRFEWQFGVGVVATLVLDATKTIGFFALTRLQFDLNSLAAIMILIGYSVTDKVVVYDRIRENLRKHKTMPLRALIDLSINQTLSRTVVTSLTVLLSILPLAFMGGESVQGFAVAIIFGIVVGTSSSIFIASPILLFLGERRLRPAVANETEQRLSATT
jgi:preprotein translocase SecF subunit